MRGYGKIILFGEHAVVYGYPALAAAISKGITAKIEPCAGENFVLSIPKWNIEITDQNQSVLGNAFSYVVNTLPQIKSKCRVILTPEIPSRAGIGSSAAASVAIIRALLKWQKLEYSLEEINALAFKVESFFHGTPSGLDNTIASVGGFCYLRDKKRFNAPETKKEFPLGKFTASLLAMPKYKISLVIINTKRERETKALVLKVKKLVEKDSQYYFQIMEKIGELALKGYQAICEGKKEIFGKLLNKNQEYLKELTVSCKEIDIICDCVLQAGALGAKLTGAGGGGCVIAYAPDRELQVQKACLQQGFESFITTIGE